MRALSSFGKLRTNGTLIFHFVDLMYNRIETLTR